MYSATTGGSSGDEVERELLSCDTEERGEGFPIKLVLLTSRSRTETTCALEKQNRAVRLLKFTHKGPPCQSPLSFVTPGERAVSWDLRSHAALSGGVHWAAGFPPVILGNLLGQMPAKSRRTKAVLGL